MNNLGVVAYVISFFVYCLLQVLFIRNWALFDVAFCFIHISFLLLLPFEFTAIMLMVLGFSLGFLTDIFYGTLGLHASACVLIAYLRPYILKLITPGGGYDNSMKPYVAVMGFRWFLTYTLSLVAIYNLCLFALEASTLMFWEFTLFKVVCSTAFTTVVMFIFQYLFYSERR